MLVWLDSSLTKAKLEERMTWQWHPSRHDRHIGYNEGKHLNLNHSNWQIRVVADGLWNWGDRFTDYLSQFIRSLFAKMLIRGGVPSSHTAILRSGLTNHSQYRSLMLSLLAEPESHRHSPINGS